MKRFLPLIFVFSLLSLTFSPKFSFAQTNKTPVTKNPVTTLPQFSSGQQVVIDQPVNQDLFAGGGQIDLKADVNGDVYIAGGQINIDKNITGNLIVAGGNVTINGQIQKNLIVAGGQIKLSENATVNGYLLATGGNIDVSGKVVGPAKLTGGNISVANTASVGGNLEIDGGQIVVSDQAQIIGERKITQRETKNVSPRPQFNKVNSVFSIIFFLGQLIILLLLVKLIKHFLISILKPAFTSLLSTLGWGLIFLIIVPFLILFLLISIIGLPLGFILSGLYILSIYLSSLFTAIFVGNWLASKNWLKTKNVYLLSFSGLFLLNLLGLIPLLGFFVKLFSLLLGLGLIFFLIKTSFLKSDQ